MLAIGTTVGTLFGWRFDGHVISLGAFVTKTVAGAAACGTRKVGTALKPPYA